MIDRWRLAAFALIGLPSLILGGCRHNETFYSMEDVFTGLVYFLEDNGGRFPASEAEFVASQFVQRQADGSLCIIARPGSPYRPRVHGVTIRDLSAYRVAWGADLAKWHVAEDGAAVDPSGKRTLLVGHVSIAEKVARDYTRDLIEIAALVRARHN
jgi:hypothetical protein